MTDSIERSSQPIDDKVAEEESTYRINRYRFNGLTDYGIKEGLTLAEAQAHCNDPATHGDGWFDGYEQEP